MVWRGIEDTRALLLQVLPLKMKSLRKLQRKLLIKKYGFLAYIFLKIVAPTGTDLDTLKKWHPSLIRIKEFANLYAKTIIYTVIFLCVMYGSIKYIFSLPSLEGVLLFEFDWMQ